MRRWWLANIGWTVAVIMVAVVLIWTYGQESGLRSCESCARNHSTWNGFVAWTVTVLGLFALLTDLDTGTSQFFDAVEAAGIGDRVTLMTVSEFGRRPAENGDGTDHGTASTHFVVGSQVRGGRYGEPHDLRSLDADGNLAVPVDFRSLYATVLDGWLGVEPDAVLGGHHHSFPLFA